MDASVIICTYNRCESLARTLDSLRRIRIDPNLLWEVLIVDNNSSDATKQVVEAASHDFPCLLRYIFEPKQGKSHALNRAIHVAYADHLLFSDDDVEVHPSWVQEVMNAFASQDCLGIGGRIEAVWNCPMPRWYGDSGPHRIFGVIIQYVFGDEPFYINVPPLGANVAFHRQAFSRYGRYNHELGPTGMQLLRGEDTEFAARVLAGGDRILYVPSAVVYHPVEPERIRKRYFERWYFHYGRTVVRREHELPACVAYFGVPRYLVRSLIGNVARWLFGYGARRRFYYRMQCCQCLGEIVENRHRRRRAATIGPDLVETPAPESGG